MHSYLSLSSGHHVASTRMPPDDMNVSPSGAGDHPEDVEIQILERGFPDIPPIIAYSGSLFDHVGTGGVGNEQPPSPGGTDNILASITPSLPGSDNPVIHHNPPATADQNDSHGTGCSSQEPSLTMGAKTASTDFTSGALSGQADQEFEHYGYDSWPLLAPTSPIDGYYPSSYSVPIRNQRLTQVSDLCPPWAPNSPRETTDRSRRRAHNTLSTNLHPTSSPLPTLSRACLYLAAERIGPTRLGKLWSIYTGPFRVVLVIETTDTVYNLHPLFFLFLFLCRSRRETASTSTISRLVAGSCRGFPSSEGEVLYCLVTLAFISFVAELYYIGIPGFSVAISEEL